MAKNILFSSLLAGASILVYGQSENETSVLDQSVNPGAVLEELPLAPPQLEGSVYLSEEWQYGTVTLTSKQQIKEYPLKYDLQKHNIEIRAGGDVKICPSSLFSEFELRDMANNTSSRYINLSLLSIPKHLLPLDGVAEVLFQDKVTLLKYHYLTIKEPTYVATVDMGNKNRKIYKKEKYFMVYGEHFKEMAKNQKRNRDMFGKHQQAMDHYITEQKLKPSKRSHLIQIVRHYNELLSNN